MLIVSWLIDARSGDLIPYVVDCDPYANIVPVWGPKDYWRRMPLERNWYYGRAAITYITDQYLIVYVKEMYFLTGELATSCDFLVTVVLGGPRVEMNPRYWNSDRLNQVESKEIMNVVLEVVMKFAAGVEYKQSMPPSG